MTSAMLPPNLFLLVCLKLNANYYISQNQRREINASVNVAYPFLTFLACQPDDMKIRAI